MSGLEVGVPNAWLLDPEDIERAFVIREGRQQWVTDATLIVDGNPIQIDLKEVKARLAE